MISIRDEGTQVAHHLRLFAFSAKRPGVGFSDPPNFEKWPNSGIAGERESMMEEMEHEDRCEPPFAFSLTIMMKGEMDRAALPLLLI